MGLESGVQEEPQPENNFSCRFSATFSSLRWDVNSCCGPGRKARVGLLGLGVIRAFTCQMPFWYKKILRPLALNEGGVQGWRDLLPPIGLLLSAWHCRVPKPINP